MRTFVMGSGPDRKFVMIEVKGNRVEVAQGNADGIVKRNDREVAGHAQARALAEKMGGELLARGYSDRTEQMAAKMKAKAEARSKSGSGSGSGSASRGQSRTAPAPGAMEPPASSGGLNVGYLLEADEEPAEEAAPLLPRMAAPAEAEAEAAPKKKKAGGKKKKRKKGGAGGDELDKRVVAACAGVGALVVAFVGYMAYDAFLKPASIVGKWAGSRLEYEIGGPMSFSQYDLVLDAQRNALMAVDGSSPAAGTYAVKGDRLILSLKDEEGEASDLEYTFALGRATLDLYDPGTDKKVVQLVRSFEEPKAGAAAAAPPAPAAVAAVDAPADAAADARLASVDFAPKDGAFKIKHPPGWEVETGSRPDNTYSWARFTKGSARIQVFADVTGSLMAGSPNDAQYEEGSEFAPVHNAHVLYKKTISEEYSDYNEGPPTLFKGSTLGEGRIAAFTASGGGLFGSQLRGCRVTFLSNDRRITVLCECPDSELKGLQATFLAVARSVSR